MCGSDGLTYPNRCHFERARCHHKDLTLVKRDVCPELRTCLQAAAYSNAHPDHGYKPQCRADGSYAPAQCHLDTGYCWCVTPDGTPLPYTSVKRGAGKPRCGSKAEVKRRRSRRQHKRRCKQNDKALFNNNLIKLLYTEWARELNRDSPKPSNNTDRLVVLWKFEYMDLSGNDYLEKAEYRDLQKIVIKAVRPKRCARSFLKACDINGDELISKDEWSECLTRDGMDGRC